LVADELFEATGKIRRLNTSTVRKEAMMSRPSVRK
jgi:hypothetical protein